MKPIKSISRRIISYDFFRGIITVGLIFSLTFFYFFTGSAEILVLYRWASLGFLFFSGLLIGQSLFNGKSALYFIRRGIQLLGIFLLINIFLLLPSQASLLDFSQGIITGNYPLVLPLLLPLGALFIILPVIAFIPHFLGFSWALLLFFLLDIVAVQKGFISLNAFFLTIGALGFFTGRVINLDSIRRIWNEKFSLLPFLCLYIALAVLVVGNFMDTNFLTIFSLFWSFHFLVLLLFYFSIPSTLFQSKPNVPRPALRQFLQPLGVEMLFVYISVSLIFELVVRVFHDFFIDNFLNASILAVHITIFYFAIIFLLQKYFRKHKKIKKIFRFIF